MAPTNEHDRPTPADRVDESAGPVALALRLSADWVSPSLARAAVRDWLRGHRWPPSAVQDVVLAVSEAVSNSIEHGYGVAVEDVHPHSVTVDLRAGLTEDGGFSRVHVEVHDRGAWRPPRESPSDRGRGMIIMRACMDHVLVDPSPDGTVVTMISRPIPVPPGR